MTRSIVVGLCVVAFAIPAYGDPKFEYADPKVALKEKAKLVEWDASVQAGFIMTTGNSETTTLSTVAQASRKEGANKAAFQAGGAFARSRALFADDTNASGAVDPGEVFEISQTASKSWFGQTRYDRFLTEHNSLYVTGKVGGDQLAGKSFIGGGQAGYSRQLVKTDSHELVAEAGYDFSYEDLASGEDLSIHSGRLFVGYKGAITTDTGVAGAIEGLANFNPLSSSAGEIDTFGDRRTTFVAELTTKIYSNINFKFGFTAKHDSAPAALPSFKIPFADGFVPLADELDTTTGASLLVNFM